MMTKQEERAALAKIEKIIKAAGPDSYIGMAFAGCCEIAADNIENDFGESMQTQAEKEIENIAEALSYCDPSNEADQESIAHLIKRLQEERPRRDKIKTLLAKLEAIGTKEV